MLVTLLPIVTEVKPLQPEKASCPMLVTLLGIITSPLTADEQPNNSVFVASLYTIYPSTNPFILFAPHGDIDGANIGPKSKLVTEPV